MIELNAQAMLAKAKQRYIEKHGGIDISGLAHKSDLPYSNVYNALFRGRKPNANIWLKLMRGLEALEASQDDVRIKG